MKIAATLHYINTNSATYTYLFPKDAFPELTSLEQSFYASMVRRSDYRFLVVWLATGEGVASL